MCVCVCAMEPAGRVSEPGRRRGDTVGVVIAAFGDKRVVYL